MPATSTTSSSYRIQSNDTLEGKPTTPTEKEPMETRPGACRTDGEAGIHTDVFDERGAAARIGIPRSSLVALRKAGRTRHLQPNSRVIRYPLNEVLRIQKWITGQQTSNRT